MEILNSFTIKDNAFSITECHPTLYLAKKEHGIYTSLSHQSSHFENTYVFTSSVFENILNEAEKNKLTAFVEYLAFDMASESHSLILFKLEEVEYSYFPFSGVSEQYTTEHALQVDYSKLTLILNQPIEPKEFHSRTKGIEAVIEDHCNK